MDIIALLKAERDKAAQQVNALDTAIRALRGLSSTRVSRAPLHEHVSLPHKKHAGHEHGAGRLSHRSQALHLSGRSSADQSGN